MADVRSGPFQLALATLRARLREGAFAPGARVTAVDVADDLRLSATPVREALSRLVGEGVLEDRPGEGFFVRRPGAGDLADLYRLSLAHLLIAHQPRTGDAAPSVPPHPDASAVVDAVERLFAGWVAAGGSRTLTTSFRTVQTQLGPVRRLEARLIPDLPAEAEALAALTGEAGRRERPHRLRLFHARRIRLADRLAAELDRPV